MYSCTNQVENTKTTALPTFCHISRNSDNTYPELAASRKSPKNLRSQLGTDYNPDLALPADLLLIERKVITVPTVHGKSVEVEHPRHDLGVDQAGERRHCLLLVDEVEAPGVLVKESRDICYMTGTR